MDSLLSQAIEAELSRGDIPAAATRAIAALAQGAEDPMLYNLAAWAREEVRDFEGARALLEKALAMAPDDVTIVAAIGGLLRKQGRLGEALAMLDRALAMAPDYAAAWLERGYAFDDAGSLQPAAGDFARAVALDPACVPAISGQAAVAARTGAFAEAQAFAARALALDPRDSVALRVAAAARLGGGDAEGAVAALADLLRRGDLAPLERFNASSLLGDAYDKAGDPAAAFAAWNDAKTVFRGLYGAHFDSGVETHCQLTKRLLAELEATDPALWRREIAGPVEGEARAHGVLCGYPRSGTTLAENVLASAPGVSALEELPTTLDTDEAYLRHPGGVSRLAAIDSAEANRLRAAYWSRVRSYGADTSDAFVDMDPLKSIKLMIFARLFPCAAIFLMLRDPRDVVLSCFRRNFAANPATYEYVTLERAVAHYDATMRLLTRSLELLPLNVHKVRYADLVRDFDTTTQAMCAALGVPWTPALRDFGQTAKTRGITTASAAQVGRGLYDGGGQWRKYEAQLAPVLPVLEAWVERLGL